MAIAALIGLSSIAGMVAFTPRQGDAESETLALQAQIRDELVSILQEKGVMWLLLTPPAEICGFLRGLSNSSVSFSGTIGSYSCGPPLPNGVPFAELGLNLVPYEVSIEGWANGTG